MLEFPSQDFRQELLKVSKYKQLRTFCLRKKKEDIRENQMEILELKNIGEINWI